MYQQGYTKTFSGKYHDYSEPGIHECVCCGNDLLSSGKKFDSGTGWPSFLGALKREKIIEEIDNSLFMRPTEIMCGTCGTCI